MIVPLCLAILASPALPATAAPPIAARPYVRPASDYEALLQEYGAAEARHEAALGAATDGDERRRLRKEHPAGEFFPRFREAAEAGEGRAYLWLIENARHSGEKRGRRSELVAGWCEALVERHLATDWFGEAVDAIGGERRALGEARQLELLARVESGAGQLDTRARACLALARTCAASRDAEVRARAVEWYERVLEAYGETSYAKDAEPELNRARYLRVGGEPLEFEATTVDGESFKLSDYRGKVVLLDFWGFW